MEKYSISQAVNKDEVEKIKELLKESDIKVDVNLLKAIVKNKLV